MWHISILGMYSLHWLFFWWCVGIGFVLKALLLNRTAGLSLARSSARAGTISLASGVLTAATPIALVVSQLLIWLADVVTARRFQLDPSMNASPAVWIPQLLIMFIFAIAVETSILRFGFKQQLSRGIVVLLTVANAIGWTVGAWAAVAEIFANPPMA